MEQRVILNRDSSNSDIFTDRDKTVKKYTKEFIINQASSVCAMQEYKEVDLSILDKYPDDAKFTLSDVSYLIRHIVLDSAANEPTARFRPIRKD